MIKPFPLFIKNNFPFIENTYEALDNYGLLCKIVEKLNEIVESENTLTNNMTALQLAFTDLKNYVDNYFANLDVQDEIDNKLDAMVEDGTLEEIISNYITSNVPRVFDTVADMIDTDLTEGMFVETKGYYAANDGGGAKYMITDSNSSTGYYETLDNTNYAKLLINDNFVNVKQLGAKGDSETDDTTKIQAGIDLLASISSGTLFFPVGEYLISTTIDLKETVILKGSHSTLYGRLNTDTPQTVIVWNGDNNSTMVKADNSKTQIYGVNIDNISFDGNNKNTIALNMSKLRNSRITNCDFNYCYKCIYISGMTYSNIIEKNAFQNFTGYAIHIDYVSYQSSNGNIISKNTISISNINTYGIYIYNANSTNILNNLIEGSNSGTKAIVIYGFSCKYTNINGNRIENYFNISGGINPEFAISILHQIEGERYCPQNTLVQNNQIFSQVGISGTTYTNPYYDLYDEGFGTIYDHLVYDNKLKNGSFIVNGSNIPFWTKNTEHATFSYDSTVNMAKIVLSDETIKWPKIYQILDAKSLRGRHLVFSYKIMVDNITTKPAIECQTYKGGNGTISNLGTLINSSYTTTPAYIDDDFIIVSNDLIVTDDCDHIFVNINFNGTGATVPANNTMYVDFICISEKLATVVSKNSDSIYQSILPVMATAQRPSGIDGLTIFDTTLAKPLYYYNGNWKDATGTNV